MTLDPWEWYIIGFVHQLILYQVLTRSQTLCKPCHSTLRFPLLPSIP